MRSAIMMMRCGDVVSTCSVCRRRAPRPGAETHRGGEMTSEEFIDAFDAEAERLGLIPDRLGGLAMAGEGREALLQRMRALKPGARWADALGHPLRRL